MFGWHEFVIMGEFFYSLFLLMAKGVKKKRKMTFNFHFLLLF